MTSLKEIFSSICQLLNKHQIDYIVIGGIAVANHGFPRNTSDIDFWYKPTTENYFRITMAFEEFGIDVSSIKESVFDPKKSFLRFPVQGVNIEFLPIILGDIPYDKAKEQVLLVEYDNFKVPVLSFDHLITNKRATDRLIDKVDVEELLKRRR